MRHIGKIAGAILGFIIFNIPGLIIGLFLGQIVDNNLSAGMNPFGNKEAIQQIFFETSFEVMGHLAKSDGRVSEKEIAAVKGIMAHLGLNAERRKIAIGYFNGGKEQGFNLLAALERLKKTCWQRPQLLKLFVEMQFRIAYADGALNSAKQAVLHSICDQLGVRGASFDFFSQFYQQQQGGQSYSGGQQYYQQHARTSIDESYQILGVTKSSTNAEIKKAYRKLMSENHPDKMIAKGLPEDMIKLANEKTAQIKDAYRQIAKAKNIK